jgi:hypothetical protein
VHLRKLSGGWVWVEGMDSEDASDDCVEEIFDSGSPIVNAVPLQILMKNCSLRLRRLRGLLSSLMPLSKPCSSVSQQCVSRLLLLC